MSPRASFDHADPPSAPARSGDAVRGLATVQLGITDLCNYQCVFCPQVEHIQVYGAAPGTRGPRMHDGAFGFMPRALVAKVLDDAVAENFPLGIVSLVWLGESTLHPDFLGILSDVYEAAATPGIIEAVVWNTNASRLTPSLCRDLVALHGRRSDRIRTTITLSLDAATERTYGVLKPGSNHARAVANVRALLDAYATGQADFREPLGLVFQFIVLPENAHEAGDFLAFWRAELASRGIAFDAGYGTHGDCQGEHSVKISFKRGSAVNQAALDRLHREVVNGLGLVGVHGGEVNRSGAREIREGANESLFPDLCSTPEPVVASRRYPCAATFETAVINWDGRVIPCCADTNLELLLGDVHDATLREILNGPIAEAYRRAHIAGEMDRIPKCAGCLNHHWPSLKDERIAEHGRRVGAPELYEAYRARLGRA